MRLIRIAVASLTSSLSLQEFTNVVLEMKYAIVFGAAIASAPLVAGQGAAYAQYVSVASLLVPHYLTS
jgi:hypothetical protein